MLEFKILDTNKNMYFIVKFQHIDDGIWKVEYPISSGGTNEVELDFKTYAAQDFLEERIFINEYYTIKWGDTSYLLTHLLGSIESGMEFIEKKLKELELIQNEYNKKVQDWIF